MRHERGISWIGAIGILVVGMLVLVGLVFVIIPPNSRHLKDSVEDLNSLKQITRMMRDSPQIYTTPDGRIDVYRMMFAKREFDPNRLRLLYSERAGKGPSEPEVRAGDYRNFPWERARLDDIRRQWVRWSGEWSMQSQEQARPVIWEREPLHGIYVVAFTDGSVVWREEDKFQPPDDPPDPK